ncbi:hypothetical protein ONS95_007534 [Cadophora gregata]|uniref:uncharacterized protein n=1 Tax=Cadophora gregata TaxID=51156 RepID=UPI0026DB98DA|nr:uncharacterized protein ONS95_007534 [Cadophora gregata]KAK0118652.1 hypothetical protein ONS96_011740 [Cadophora gregata f. sp. sojae]KAK0125910.1 hypothetical protein ONS95_007534 [Cadophora gregata]
MDEYMYSVESLRGTVLEDAVVILLIVVTILLLVFHHCTEKTFHSPPQFFILTKDLFPLNCYHVPHRVTLSCSHGNQLVMNKLQITDPGKCYLQCHLPANSDA